MVDVPDLQTIIKELKTYGHNYRMIDIYMKGIYEKWTVPKFTTDEKIRQTIIGELTILRAVIDEHTRGFNYPPHLLDPMCGHWTAFIWITGRWYIAEIEKIKKLPIWYHHLVKIYNEMPEKNPQCHKMIDEILEAIDPKK